MYHANNRIAVVNKKNGKSRRGRGRGPGREPGRSGGRGPDRTRDVHRSTGEERRGLASAGSRRYLLKCSRVCLSTIKARNLDVCAAALMPGRRGCREGRAASLPPPAPPGCRGRARWTLRERPGARAASARGVQGADHRGVATAPGSGHCTPSRIGTNRPGIPENAVSSGHASARTTTRRTTDAATMTGAADPSGTAPSPSTGTRPTRASKRSAAVADPIVAPIAPRATFPAGHPLPHGAIGTSPTWSQGRPSTKRPRFQGPEWSMSPMDLGSLGL